MILQDGRAVTVAYTDFNKHLTVYHMINCFFAFHGMAFVVN